jgi:hypothetical protein
MPSDKTPVDSAHRRDLVRSAMRWSVAFHEVPSGSASTHPNVPSSGTESADETMIDLCLVFPNILALSYKVYDVARSNKRRCSARLG